MPRQFLPDSPHAIHTDHWHRLEDQRVQCDICPRACKLHEGQRGACFVRGCQQGAVVLHSYGKSSGFCIDPIEKKPLNHFLPGTPVLSFGTAGCNLACKFCQNWDMSKSREMDTLSAIAMPETLAQTALQHQCRAVAFTYNDPVIFHEYATDTARACADVGIKSIAVTAGYMSPQPRRAFFETMDAANVDLKAFSSRFYKKLCGASLHHVLDTLTYIKHETDVWLEITTLLIPGENDSSSEIAALCEWVITNLGEDVPLHFTAFHPDWKMRDTPRTPAATLQRARSMALQTGLQYVYTGNVHDDVGNSTWCVKCGNCLIARNWYELGRWHIHIPPETALACCEFCANPVPGFFESAPGEWGAQRLPVVPLL